MIERTTRGGTTLRRLVLDEKPDLVAAKGCGTRPAPGPLEPIRHALQDTWKDAKAGEIEHVVVLGVTDYDTVRLYNTVEGLGELALIRDAFAEMIDSLRQGD